MEPSQAIAPEAPRTVTLLGLFLALVGPGIVAWSSSRSAASGSVGAGLAGTAALIVLAATVVAVVRWGERRDLASIGVVPPSAGSFGWAAVLVAANVLVLTPIMQWLVERIGAGFGSGLLAFRMMPLWYRIAVVLVVPALEEMFYRGYAIDRLSNITKSPAAGVVVSGLVFGLAHAPVWGIGAGVALVIPALVHGAFYAWRRDLIALVISHIATDVLGLFLWEP